MYTLDEKLEAVKLYNETKSYAVVKRMLGYPNSDDALRIWVKVYANGTSSKRKEYTKEEIEFAVEYYKECRSATTVIKDLGYPKTNSILYRWISKNGNELCRERKKNVEYSEDEKKQFVKLFLKSNQSQVSFSQDYDFTPQTLGNWIRRYSSVITEETENMPSNNIENKETQQNDSIKDESQNNEISDTETIEKLKKELAALKAEQIKNNAELKKVQLELKEANLKVEQAQLEYDILEKAAELLKKEKGINIESLTNKEKAIVVNALRYKYKLVLLLKAIKMAKSSYEYQNKHIGDDKYKEIKNKMVEIFNDNYKAFGYRRIHASLKNAGTIISEKVIRRLMKEIKIRPYIPRMKKYSSYEGEISPAVEDLYKHKFKSDAPYKKLVTDITEFSLKDGKVYLSPMIDLYDGAPITWTIGTSPNKELTNTMLINLHNMIPSTERPIIHSDRGCHYRIPDWISLMNEFGYTRSMSRKGCSADNSACEGYFGILKREFFHNHDWSNTSREEFIKELEKYLVWFKTKRIKKRLGFVSPADYRNQATY